MARPKREQDREHSARAEETPQQREERLTKRREQNREHRATAQETQDSHCDGLARQSETEIFEQYTVRRKISMFNSKLMSLEVHSYSTCFECFPDLSISSRSSSECTCCSQDRHIPKLYSAANNMNPGTVPPQLQAIHVQYTLCLCYYANYVNPPSTSWPVWLHRSCDQSTAKCHVICS